MLTRAITAQQAYYRQLGLRDRLLNLPLMVAWNVNAVRKIKEIKEILKLRL